MLLRYLSSGWLAHWVGPWESRLAGEAAVRGPVRGPVRAAAGTQLAGFIREVIDVQI